MTQDTQQLSVRRGLSKMTKDPNGVGFEFLDASNSMAFDGLLSTLSARRNNARLKRNKTISRVVWSSTGHFYAGLCRKCIGKVIFFRC